MASGEKLTIYVVDDQAIIRAALCQLLSVDCGFDVVGKTGDAREAISQIGKLRPDVVTLDVTMPGLSGIDAIPQLLRVSPRSKILMLTNHESGRFLEESLRAGASGFLTKDSEPAELRMAVEAVAAGRRYITPRVTGSLVERLLSADGDEDQESGEPPVVGRLASLTPREREVFHLLSVGKANKEVARELSITLGTVKKHRENLQRKLDARSPAELARIAIQEGWLAT